MVYIRPEQDADLTTIRAVNQDAFGGIAEADLVDALREGGFAMVSLVAIIESTVVGHILFSPVTIADREMRVSAVSLAPMAVQPAFQRQGIGSQLVNAGLEACKQHRQQIAVVLGPVSYTHLTLPTTPYV